jgi:hypothetical protein
MHGIMERTRVGGRIHITDCIVSIKDSQCLTGFEIDGMVEVQIDSCVIGYNVDAEGTDQAYEFIGTKYAQITIERSLIYDEVSCEGFMKVHFINNTFATHFGADPIIEIKNRRSYDSTDYVIKNNIMLCRGNRATLFDLDSRPNEDQYPDVRYNCCWEFDEVISRHDGFWFRFDTTNIIENPLVVERDSLNFNLTEDSPCIDAGDPNGPLDPDGTRADIGAYFYDSEASVDRSNPNPTPNLVSMSTYPNPFNSSTTISFTLPNSSDAVLSVFDMTGRLVETLTDGVRPAGKHSVVWNGMELASGIYFIRLDAGEFHSIGKVVLVK